MEEPYLESEVSLLVLRYLAGIGCKNTARSFFKELPSLKEVLRSKNRGGETPRAFDGPQVHGSLGDILFDYGNAKLIVKSLVEKLLSDWGALPKDSISACDTLATQLRQINTLMSSTFSTGRFFCTNDSSFSRSILPPPKRTCDASTQTHLYTVIRTKRIASTCTTLDLPESLNIVVMNVKTTCNAQVQTDLIESEPQPPTVIDEDEGEWECIRLMFYNNLLNNTGLQEIIAKNINQQFESDNTGDEEKVVKTVSSKTENEIDNFLSNLLHGEENSQGGFSYSWNSIPLEFETADQGSGVPSIGTTLLPSLVDNIQPQAERLTTPSEIESLPTDLNTPGKTYTQMQSVKEIPAKALPPNMKSKAEPSPKILKPFRKRYIHTQSLPIVKSTNATIRSNKSPWQKLGRRNIVPKIPTTASSVRAPVPQAEAINETTKPIMPFNVCQVDTLETVKIAASVSSSDFVKQARQIIKNVQIGRQNIVPKMSTSASSALAPVELAEAINEPTKLIIPPYVGQVDTLETIQVVATVSSSDLVKTTSQIAKNVQIEPGNLNSRNNRIEKMSPLLLRLIASAQKIRQSASELEKKSYSTPRKKKHVRNLLFSTPASLNKGSTSNNATVPEVVVDKDDTKSTVGLVKDALTRKRKATQMASESQTTNFGISEGKSRRRLNLPDEIISEHSDLTDHEEKVVQIIQNPANMVIDSDAKSEISKRSKREPHRSKNKDYSTTIETVVQSSQELHTTISLIANNIINVKKVENKPVGKASSHNKTTPPANNKIEIESKVTKGKGRGRQGKLSITPPSLEKQTVKRKTRQSEEDYALQAVSHTAIPLGRSVVSPLRKVIPLNSSYKNSGEISTVQSQQSKRSSGELIASQSQQSKREDICSVPTQQSKLSSASLPGSSGSVNITTGSSPILSKGALNEIPTAPTKEQPPSLMSPHMIPPTPLTWTNKQLLKPHTTQPVEKPSLTVQKLISKSQPSQHTVTHSLPDISQNLQIQPQTSIGRLFPTQTHQYHLPSFPQISNAQPIFSDTQKAQPYLSETQKDQSHSPQIQLPLPQALQIQPPLPQTPPVQPPLPPDVQPPLTLTLQVQPPLPSTYLVQPPLPSTLVVQPPIPQTPRVQPPLPLAPHVQLCIPKTSQSLSLPRIQPPVPSQANPTLLITEAPSIATTLTLPNISETSLVRPKMNRPKLSVFSKVSSPQPVRPSVPPSPPPCRPSVAPPPPPYPLVDKISISVSSMPKSPTYQFQSKSGVTQSTRVLPSLLNASEKASIVPGKQSGSLFNTVTSNTPVKMVDGTGSAGSSRHVPLTPRFLVNFSGDSSWESGDGHITLNYENNGIFPTNLSTPLKSGLPGTPERRSPPSDNKSRSSSSIFDTSDVAIFKDQNRPDSGDLNTPVPKQSIYIPPTATVSVVETHVSAITNVNHQENCDVSSTSQDIIRSHENVLPSTLRDVPEVIIPDQQECLQFEVSGRAKKLTFSEKQTLFSLLEMREGLGSPNTKASTDPPVLQPKIGTDVMSLLKNVNLDDFLTFVHGARK